MWNVFEQPWTLFITAVALLPVVAITSVFIQEKYKGRIWLIPLILAITAFGLDFAVQTDREKIEGVIKAGATAMEDEDCDAIAAILAENYKDSAHSSKAAIMVRCRAILVEPFVDTAICQIRQIDITGDSAKVTINARILFDKKSDAFVPGVQASAEIYLQKTKENQWLISRTEILTSGGHDATWQDVNYQNW